MIMADLVESHLLVPGSKRYSSTVLEERHADNDWTNVVYLKIVPPAESSSSSSLYIYPLFGSTIYLALDCQPFNIYISVSQTPERQKCLVGWSCRHLAC